MKTARSSKLLTTIVCCSQHVEILTNFVSSRHWAKCPIFGLFAKFGKRRRRNETDIGQILLALIVIRIVLLTWLLTTLVCCLQHVEILTNSVSACHRPKCLIFLLITKFGGRRRRNKNEYRLDCFSAEVHQNCCWNRIIYHDCLLLTTRRNIDETCIGTSPGEMADFRTLRQVRRSTSSKLKRVSARFF